ncbi:MAG TPA: hypothetical protein VFE78_12740 [Gemmataceae bacterium]|jgi:hypothetical protein|nr:hypothetical protein [Gemmataceae bacterium]
MGLQLAVLIVTATLALLVACWLIGDLEPRTKVILTVVYLASWVVAIFNVWAFIGVQAMVSLAIFLKTFGHGH